MAVLIDHLAVATAMCTAFCFNYAGLIVCRLMLGIFEAGLFPGVIVSLTYATPARQPSLMAFTNFALLFWLLLLLSCSTFFHITTLGASFLPPGPSH